MSSYHVALTVVDEMSYDKKCKIYIYKICMHIFYIYGILYMYIYILSCIY